MRNEIPYCLNFFALEPQEKEKEKVRHKVKYEIKCISLKKEPSYHCHNNHLSFGDLKKKVIIATQREKETPSLDFHCQQHKFLTLLP